MHDFCLSVPFNGDLNLVEKVSDFESAKIFYGRPSAFTDASRGGRAAAELREISKENFVGAVAKAKKKGIEFQYVLNGILPKAKLSNGLRKAVEKEIGFAEEAGAGLAIVANKKVAGIVKESSGLRVGVSKFARVNSVKRAKEWIEAGADQICLDLNITRDFGLLEKLSELPVELQLLANDSCLANCPWEDEHAEFSSKGSLEGKGFYSHEFSFKCRKRFFAEPEEIERAEFILPCGLQKYVAIGIRNFKLIDRRMETARIVKIVEAYDKGQYGGNLLDLFSLQGHLGKAVDIAVAKMFLKKKGLERKDIEFLFWNLPAIADFYMDKNGKVSFDKERQKVALALIDKAEKSLENGMKYGKGCYGI